MSIFYCQVGGGKAGGMVGGETQTAGKRSRTAREIQPGQRAPAEGSICTEKGIA